MLRKIISTTRIPDKLIVPCGRQVLTGVRLSELAFEEGQRRGKVQLLSEQPSEHQFYSIRPALSHGYQPFITDYAIIITFARQRNTVDHRKGHVVVTFVKAFGCQFHRLIRPPRQPQTFLSYRGIFQGTVDIHSVSILKSQGCIRRKLIIQSHVSTQVPSVRQTVRNRHSRRKLTPQFLHAAVVIVTIRTYTQRSRKAFIHSGII